MRGRPVAQWVRDAAARQVREAGWSRAEVAEDLRVSATAVSRWVEDAIEAERAAARRVPTEQERQAAAVAARLAAAEADNAILRQAMASAWMTMQGQLGAGSSQPSLRPGALPLHTSSGSPEVPLHPVVPLSDIPRQQDGEQA